MKLLFTILLMAFVATADAMSCPGSKSPFADSDRDLIVNRHNELRSSLAQGKEIISKGVYAPSASNIQKMSYSCDLEYGMMAYAGNCDFNGHSQVPGYGENLYWAMQSAGMAPQSMSHHLSEAMNAWWNEMRGKQWIKTTNALLNMEAGHWTQMAWAETAYVGCGGASCTDNSNNAITRIYCRYFTPGNYNGAQVYKPGPSCSSCTKGCDKETSLCNPDSAPPPKTSVDSSPFISSMPLSFGVLVASVFIGEF